MEFILICQKEKRNISLISLLHWLINLTKWTSLWVCMYSLLRHGPYNILLFLQNDLSSLSPTEEIHPWNIFLFLFWTKQAGLFLFPSLQLYMYFSFYRYLWIMWWVWIIRPLFFFPLYNHRSFLAFSFLTLNYFLDDWFQILVSCEFGLRTLLWLVWF